MAENSRLSRSIETQQETDESLKIMAENARLSRSGESEQKRNESRIQRLLYNRKKRISKYARFHNTFRMQHFDDFKESCLQTYENIFENNQSYLFTIGKPKIVCEFCKSRMWILEKLSASSYRSPKFSLCCGSGKISLLAFKPPPPVINRLFFDQDSDAIFFRKNIRSINSSLAFASFNAKTISNPRGGPQSFKIQGQTYMSIGSLLPQEKESSKFMAIYFHDSDTQLNLRMNYVNDTQQGRRIVSEI